MLDKFLLRLFSLLFFLLFFFRTVGLFIFLIGLAYLVVVGNRLFDSW
jgi:hypothetical protein